MQDNKYKDIVALASLGQSFINKKETPRKLLLQHATLSHIAAAGSCNANLQDFSSTLAHCCRVIFRSRMLSARIQNGIRCAIPFLHFIFPPYKECDMSKTIRLNIHGAGVSMGWMIQSLKRMPQGKDLLIAIMTKHCGQRFNRLSQIVI